MPARLASRQVAPPGHFQFSIPELGIKVRRFYTFAQMLNDFIPIAQAHPELNLPTDRATAELRLDGENALRVSRISGADQYVVFTVPEPTSTPRPDQTCMVQLGRFGDLMIMLPALKHIFDTDGVKPMLMTCREFADILDGVSYVEPWVLDGISWISGLRTAYEGARQYTFKNVIVPKYWDCQGMQPAFVPDETGVLDQSKLAIPIADDEWNSYMFSQWKASGFTRQQIIDWPLVFDKRDLEREATFCKPYFDGTPVVLLNFTGFSNRMWAEPEITDVLKPLMGRVKLVNLKEIRAPRIFDLFGMFDRSLCLVTGDTSTLHLASASKIPLIALQAEGGAGSLVKGNAKLKIRYSEVKSRMHEVREVIEGLL
jgi:hypothetical protein